MANLFDILIYPHEILSARAKPVEKIDQEFQDFVDRMIRTMYVAKGVGLAANQVGSLLRVVVMDISQERGREQIVLVNPVITAAEGSEKAEEACLSVPGYAATLVRPSEVEVKGFDRHGKEISLQGDGLFARCVQHELDHLDGICYVDRLSPLKKGLFRKKWRKIHPGQDRLPAKVAAGDGD